MEKEIEEEWEMVDYYPYLEDEQDIGKSKLGWVIDRGLSVGKKLVITGMLISSVPLVLPPLVVISALGFALSVPFGVLFASYACSQKVMSKLLPSPPLSGESDFYRTVGARDEEEEKQIEDVKSGIEMRFESVDSEHDDGDGPRDGLDNDFVKNGEEQQLLEQGKNSVNVEVQSDEKKIDEGEKNDMEREKLVQEKVMTETKKAEADSKAKGRRGKKKLHGKRKEEETNKSSEKLIGVEERRSTDELGGVPSENKHVGERGHSNGDGNILANDDSGDVRVDYSEVRIVGDDGLEVAVAAATVTAATEGKSGLDSDEGLVGDEKIWEKIDAIRGIVGFKAPKRPSYYEELNALYLFTGIEPPSTSSDEFSNNLSFLMSVIGLK